MAFLDKVGRMPHALFWLVFLVGFLMQGNYGVIGMVLIGVADVIALMIIRGVEWILRKTSPSLFVSRNNSGSGLSSILILESGAASLGFLILIQSGLSLRVTDVGTLWPLLQIPLLAVCIIWEIRRNRDNRKWLVTSVLLGVILLPFIFFIPFYFPSVVDALLAPPA